VHRRGHENTERPSIEGRIVERVTKDGVGQPVELWKAVAAVLRTGDENPWVKALERCRDEARDAGLIEVRGLLRKRITADNAALAAWEPRFEDVVARLKRAEIEEHELVAAIWEDCDNGLADRQVLTRSV
jgi:hypothetical protein